MAANIPGERPGQCQAAGRRQHCQRALRPERKHSALELLEKSRHKARDIFERTGGLISQFPHNSLGVPHSGCAQEALTLHIIPEFA